MKKRASFFLVSNYKFSFGFFPQEFYKLSCLHLYDFFTKSYRGGCLTYSHNNRLWDPIYTVRIQILTVSSRDKNHTLNIFVPLGVKYTFFFCTTLFTPYYLYRFLIVVIYNKYLMNVNLIVFIIHCLKINRLSFFFLAN